MQKCNVLKKVMFVILLFCAVTQSESPVYADINEPQNIPQRSQGTNDDCNDKSPVIPLNQENIKQFIDEYFQANMKKWKVPGVAVSVVENDKELYKAGYGVSDLETNNPVDPDTTTFPAASISKLFTATAIMQLYQSGKLDLNEDILTYANDITIKNPFHEDITCQNLLTHSSGLDEASELDGGTLDRNSIKSQKAYFNEHVPSVVLQPNTVCRYSNMGYNLLGYIVEKVSGESYESYASNHILEPLDMKHSSIRIENTSMARGYEYSDGKYQKASFAYQYTSGSSGVIATVTDMENFMRMHLNSGRLENKYIIDSRTEALMQKKQFTNNQVFDGMGEGFIRNSRNGVQILKHEGALPGYTATLLLIPSQEFGIYVATNSLGGMVFDFEEAFLTHFFGAGHTVSNKENSAYDADKYIGTYRTYDGVSMNNISKIFAAIDYTSELKVQKTTTGNLTVTYYNQSKEKVHTNLIYQSQGIFIREDGKGHITFREKKNGKIIYAFNNISHQTYMKIGELKATTAIYFELPAFALILLVSSIIILIKAIKHKQKNNKSLWFINGLINLLYLLGFIGVLVLEAYMIINYDYRLMWMLYVFLTALFLAMLLNIYGLFAFGYGMIKRKFDKQILLKLSMLQVVQILFVMTLGYFNMIGYHVF
jgi:CubicO group peptidase (beta-lactamase class C family)